MCSVKRCSWKFHKIQRKTSVPGLRPATLLTKRLWFRCFPVNFVEFPRTMFFIEHLWWLLLVVVCCFVGCNVVLLKHLLIICMTYAWLIWLCILFQIVLCLILLRGPPIGFAIFLCVKSWISFYLSVKSWIWKFAWFLKLIFILLLSLFVKKQQ